MTFEEEIPGTKKIEGKWYFLFQNNIDIDPSQIMQFQNRLAMKGYDVCTLLTTHDYK